MGMLSTLTPQPTCWYFYLSFSGASRDVQVLCLSSLLWILFRDPAAWGFSLGFLLAFGVWGWGFWFGCFVFFFLFYFKAVSLLLLPHINKLYHQKTAGQVFADLWSGFHSLLLMNCCAFLGCTTRISSNSRHCQIYWMLWRSERIQKS